MAHSAPASHRLDESQPVIPWRVALQQSSASASPAGSSFIPPAASVNHILSRSTVILPFDLQVFAFPNLPGLLANSEMAQRSIPAP